jgi:hypothetical protein
MLKKTAFISGAFSFSVLAMATFFKVMHLPGANRLLQAGLLVFALLFVPTITKYLYDKEK